MTVDKLAIESIVRVFHRALREQALSPEQGQKVIAVMTELTTFHRLTAQLQAGGSYSDNADARQELAASTAKVKALCDELGVKLAGLEGSPSAP